MCLCSRLIVLIDDDDSTLKRFQIFRGRCHFHLCFEKHFRKKFELSHFDKLLNLTCWKNIVDLGQVFMHRKFWYIVFFCRILFLDIPFTCSLHVYSLSCCDFCGYLGKQKSMQISSNEFFSYFDFLLIFHTSKKHLINSVPFLNSVRCCFFVK